MQTKTNYIEGTNLQLDLWGDQFATLEEELSRASLPARAPLRRKLESLRRKKRSLKRRLREAAHGTTVIDWEDVRGPLEKAVEEFRALAIEVYDQVRVA